MKRDYFPRNLRYKDDDGQTVYVKDTALLTLVGPKILLGEPGMGKTELIRQLGLQIGVEPISAVRFMHSKNPASFVCSDKPLLIDALDEAIARKEGDAVDAILAQLETANCPNFILSCRAREWQARTHANLKILYGLEPNICTLEPFSRLEAHAFLKVLFPWQSSAKILDHLDVQNLADLYSNPLTLGLMGKVAETDDVLPKTRAMLFERVCAMLWPEHDPERQDFGLAQLTEHEALDAAGAMCAALLFSGREALTLAGAVQASTDDLRISDVSMIANSKHVRLMFASKLFQGVGLSRAKPIHRVIAEFLAARWLAVQAGSPRLQRRLLTQFQFNGAVPASLRGLHAWIAYHSSSMANKIIKADPYGIMRYGEVESLTSQQAECLFDALSDFAETDPYFRANDWDSHTAAGLMIPSLQNKIQTVINSSESNAHLRSLFIEGLKGTKLAIELAPTLATIVFSRERFYRERHDAVEAILKINDKEWALKSIEKLRCMGDEDSTRLAMNLIRKVGTEDVSDEVLVSAIFAEIGCSVSAVPKQKDNRSNTLRHYGRIAIQIKTERIVAVLDLISEYALELIEARDWQNENAIADLIAELIVRAFDEGAITATDAPRIWNWLGLLERAHHYNRTGKQDIALRLTKDDAIRRAVQKHVLSKRTGDETIWTLDYKLQHRLVGIQGRPADIEFYLTLLADAGIRSESTLEDWRDLLRLARNSNGLSPEIKTQAARFACQNAELENFIKRIENPPLSDWQRKDNQRQIKQERKRKAEIESDLRHYSANKAKIKAGELEAIVPLARAYLGSWSDIDQTLPPFQRISEWVGDELRDDAIEGFEAVLHRNDLPSLETIAASAVEGTIYNFAYAIVAAFLERYRTGRGIDDLDGTICWTALFLFENDWMWHGDDAAPAVQKILEKRIFQSTEDRIRFVRARVEPYLVARHHHVPSLYKLANDEDWHCVGGILAAEWLEEYPDLPEHVEIGLIECLTHAGEFDRLRKVAELRNSGTFRNFDHMLAWIAVDLLVRFDDVIGELANIGHCTPNFIWHLRNRFTLERHGNILSLTVAQQEWVISEFRGKWPYVTIRGSSSGDTNPHDATDFLRSLISLLADDISEEAGDALQRLGKETEDTYTDLIRHMAAEQNQKRAENSFNPISPSDLAKLLSGGEPSNIDDLKCLVLEEIYEAQAKLKGEDIDQLRDFWTDNGVPRNENRCRDRLAAMIGPELSRYNVLRITEADMPNNKRVDLAFAHGANQLPMEIKGQWHNEVWNAASSQLDRKYLLDWRSQQRGIYCVLWFGEQKSQTGRRMKTHPSGLAAPTNPDQMKSMIIDLIPEARRSLIDVVVLDLERA